MQERETERNYKLSKMAETCIAIGCSEISFLYILLSNVRHVIVFSQKPYLEFTFSTEKRAKLIYFCMRKIPKGNILAVVDIRAFIRLPFRNTLLSLFGFFKCADVLYLHTSSF